MMNKLDLTKKVQTRDGRPVEIKFTDGRGDYPICGYIGDGPDFESWASDGRFYLFAEKPHNADLINVPEWHLPDPPHGYEWHRTDWTEDMLPDGWRPLLLGEATQNGDQRLCGNEWESFGTKGLPLYVNMANARHMLLRTRRPLPPPKPQMREVELCADDIKAGDEFLVGSYRHTWLSIKDGYVTYGSGGIYSFEEMMRHGHKIRSVGETEWRKCSKQEEVPA